MPIIKSAKKRMRQEKKRTEINRAKKLNIKTLIKKTRVSKTAENLTSVFSALDKAVKVGLIHQNRASRLKSRLSKGTEVSSGAIKKATKKKVIRKTNKR